MTRRLEVDVSDTLWAELLRRSGESGQSISHIVQSALAEALDVEHHSVFQVSTSGAIVNGLYQGCVRVADLRRHGDVGLGTFEELDGEMIMVDGRCFQARSDGTVVEAPDGGLTPFATVVNFACDWTADLDAVTSFADFEAKLDAVRTSENAILSFLVSGTFASIRLRTACKTNSGVDLVEATSKQRLFDFEEIRGTLVGFWFPEYAKSIAISGYHVHFISEDRQHGGHVLDLRADRLLVEVNDVNDLRLAIPESAAFLKADLAGDHDDALRIAEHGDRGRARRP